MRSNRVLRRLTGALAIAATGAVIAVPHGAAQAADNAKTQEILEKWAPNGGPGSAIYARDSDDSWTLSSGSAGLGENRDLKATDPFRVASQTKSFTAAAIFTLVEEGKLDLDAPVEQIIPGVISGNGHDATKFTPRQLLQHVSGLPTSDITGNLLDLPGIVRPDGSISLKDLIQVQLKSNKPAAEPGTKVVYSNLGYEILGLIIEQLTGKSAREAITERVINPAGLKNTYYPVDGDRSLPENHIKGYRGIPRTEFGTVWWEATSFPVVSEPTAIATAGAIVSTLEDMTAFYSALITPGKIISAESLAAMQELTPVPEFGDVRFAGMGHGLLAIKLSCDGEIAWGHNGASAAGYYSFTAVTADGRQASTMTNAYDLIAGEGKTSQLDLLDAALCELDGKPTIPPTTPPTGTPTPNPTGNPSTPAVSTTPVAQPKPGKDKGELARTGSAVTGVFAAGAALLVGGVVVTIVARRRRAVSSEVV